MDFNILKNPIILAISASALTYLYLYWENEKKYKEDQENKEKINYAIPIATGIIVWFIANSVFSDRSSAQLPLQQPIQSNIGGNQPAYIPKIQNSVTGSSEMFKSNTYRLIGRNSIKLPQTDVFIDFAKF
jgi:hypothetical protein